MDKLVYYGILLEILELSFIFDRKAFLFRCKWYDWNPCGRNIVVDQNLTSINTSSQWYTDESSILATQAQQVFYLDDRWRSLN